MYNCGNWRKLDRDEIDNYNSELSHVIYCRGCQRNSKFLYLVHDIHGDYYCSNCGKDCDFRYFCKKCGKGNQI